MHRLSIPFSEDLLDAEYFSFFSTVRCSRIFQLFSVSLSIPRDSLNPKTP